MKIKQIFIVCSLIAVVALLSIGLYFNNLKIKESINEDKVITPLCDSKLADAIGLVKVKHKYFGYETCIKPNG